MSMNVHQADLATEEGGRLGALEYLLRPTVILHGPIHQSSAVREQQVLADNAKVVARLFRGEQSSENTVRHRQKGILEVCAGVARMDQELGPLAAGFEQSIACNGIVADQKTIEIPPHV